MRLFITIALLTASFYGGWHLRTIKAQRDGLHIQAEYAQQRAAAQQQARQRELGNTRPHPGLHGLSVRASR